VCHAADAPLPPPRPFRFSLQGSRPPTTAFPFQKEIGFSFSYPQWHSFSPPEPPVGLLLPTEDFSIKPVFLPSFSGPGQTPPMFLPCTARRVAFFFSARLLSIPERGSCLCHSTLKPCASFSPSSGFSPFSLSRGELDRGRLQLFLQGKAFFSFPRGISPDEGRVGGPHIFFFLLKFGILPPSSLVNTITSISFLFDDEARVPPPAFLWPAAFPLLPLCAALLFADARYCLSPIGPSVLASPRPGSRPFFAAATTAILSFPPPTFHLSFTERLRFFPPSENYQTASRAFSPFPQDSPALFSPLARGQINVLWPRPTLFFWR